MLCISCSNIEISIFLVFSGIWTFLVDAYPAYAASALAANTFTRCMFAGAFPLFGDQSQLTAPTTTASERLLTKMFPTQCTKNLATNGQVLC